MASEQIESKNDKRKKAVIMSNDRALKLIQLIKNRECLWNKLHRTGINQSQVADAWKEVSIKMQLPVDFLQQKWNSLQGTFRHVRAIHEKIIATAPDAKNVRQPTWFAYRAMLFLNHVNVSRVKAESSNQQLICNVRVEANSTHEEQKYGDVNQEGLDIFANESKISKTRSFKLSHARTLQLIQLIKNRKCLWNKYHPTAINQSVDDAWKEVSIKMRLPVDFLKHRWNSLKGSYRGRKSIRAKAIAAASDGKSVRPPCWFAYESMLFLNEVSVWRVKAESSNQQSICNVTVEGNSTHEQQGEINEEASDIFTNEVKHSDNIAIDTSITETEGDSTYEEYGDVNQEGLDIFANESKITKTRSFKLSHARTLQLIQLIKNRKCLWNKYHPTAINQSVDDAWKEVSIKMRLPVDFLKHRWNSLKGTYRRIKSIRAKPLAAASVGKSVRPPGWFAYESMLFLNEVSVWRVKAESSNQQSICNVTVEGNSTHEEQGEINEEASDIFTNEVKHSDNIAIDTSIPETEGDSTYKEYGDVNQEGLDIFANESKVSKTRLMPMSQNRTLQLIQLIKNRECLWSKLHRTGINRSRIANAWKEVSIKMRLPVDFVQRKWKSLQASYRTLKSIHTKRIAAASDGNSVRQPRWFAYRDLMFLNQVHASRVMRQHTIPEPIYQVIVEPNSTYEEHNDTDQEVSDIFANEMKHSDNIAIDTLITKTERDTTYEEHGETKEEVSNANESAYRDSIATNTASSESEGVRFGALMARKLDNMSPIRRKRMILKLEKLLLDEEEARFVEKYGPL
ncbi:uncharacterized protein LOC126570550 isoform X1 [Anopheles aquasalis]|uniref:uncharacterized protein LOC126570550 isoform X1 n=1 Tax=Anopheles aquasalis TaxID=42839 RepID=UPI00215A5F82|nr:uncharacterized protein LOC126570550 isoform X1 [Anopheles aquasalis]